MNLTVQFLQRFYFSTLVVLHIADSFCRCLCRCDGSEVRNLCLDGCLSQITVIVNTVFSDRRVDDQVDLSVGNQIQNIRTAFV